MQGSGKPRTSVAQRREKGIAPKLQYFVREEDESIRIWCVKSEGSRRRHCIHSTFSIATSLLAHAHANANAIWVWTLEEKTVSNHSQMLDYLQNILEK